MIKEIDKKISQLEEIAHLEDSSSVRQQINLINKISKESQGPRNLFNLLINRQESQNNIQLAYIDGILFKYLYHCKIDELKIKMSKYLNEGIVSLKSEHNIDYKPLYFALVNNNFKEANKLTQLYLSQLTNINRQDKRQWLYFTDIFSLPVQDLQTIDQLWTIYSIGKFGFSIQRRIWLYNNKDWEKFWHTIGWKINKKNKRYPNEFTWDQTAPTGHLPLFNQIRGVQVLATLFMHPAWESENYMTN